MGLFENCPKHYKSNTHLPPYKGGSSVVCLVMGGLLNLDKYSMHHRVK